MLISIVIPVFNSRLTSALADRIAAVFAERPESHEIIFVDDGSTDPAVWPELEQLARGRPRVKAIRLSKNFGQSAATLCGLNEANGDYIITMDDDLEHDPESIPKFLELK